MKKTALITGATSGIREATAYEFAKQGINLILCRKCLELLITILNALERLTNLHVLNFDVRDKDTTNTAIAALPKPFSNIDMLINNTDNAYGLGPIEDGNDCDAMMHINVKGLLYVSKAVTPTMSEQKPGYIINIGSSAGKEVYPKGKMYCASKHAVLAVTEGMRIHLNPYGIKVGSTNPGLIETEFSKGRFKGGAALDHVYKGFNAFQAKDLAEINYFTVSRPFHINIADVLVFPTVQAYSVT